MQPKLYFSKGFCNYDCTICGEVCPTGAILPLTKEEKNHTQMGGRCSLLLRTVLSITMKLTVVPALSTVQPKLYIWSPIKAR